MGKYKRKLTHCDKVSDNPQTGVMATYPLYIKALQQSKDLPNVGTTSQLPSQKLTLQTSDSGCWREASVSASMRKKRFRLQHSV